MTKPMSDELAKHIVRLRHKDVREPMYGNSECPECHKRVADTGGVVFSGRLLCVVCGALRILADPEFWLDENSEVVVRAAMGPDHSLNSNFNASDFRELRVHLSRVVFFEQQYRPKDEKSMSEVKKSLVAYSEEWFTQGMAARNFVSDKRPLAGASANVDGWWRIAGIHTREQQIFGTAIDAWLNAESLISGDAANGDFDCPNCKKPYTLAELRELTSTVATEVCPDCKGDCGDPHSSKPFHCERCGTTGKVETQDSIDRRKELADEIARLESVSGDAGVEGGKWTVRKEDRSINGHWHETWEIESDGVGIAVVLLPHEDANDEIRREREDKANLIAAAPMLYEALANILSRHDCGGFEKSSCDKAWSALRAAQGSRNAAPEKEGLRGGIQLEGRP